VLRIPIFIKCFKLKKGNRPLSKDFREYRSIHKACLHTGYLAYRKRKSRRKRKKLLAKRKHKIKVKKANALLANVN
jgi:hypothetical protein